MSGRRREVMRGRGEVKVGEEERGGVDNLTISIYTHIILELCAPGNHTTRGTFYDGHSHQNILAFSS